MANPPFPESEPERVREVPRMLKEAGAVLSEIGPVKELTPEETATLPACRVSASATEYVTALRSSVAPAETVVPAAFEPSAPLAVTMRLPAETVVGPV